MPFLERAVLMVCIGSTRLHLAEHTLSDHLFLENAQCLINIIISYKNLKSILFIVHSAARFTLSEDLLSGALGKGLQPRLRS